ncbi:SDR family oxidoreductase [Burkholderia pyrrocinia]|uniref:SDR family NAD(P)-dependent oxidoreductase n=1 Tax=Burkholderia pyrrocinia TaxID=60550 RepID=UPI0030D61188
MKSILVTGVSAGIGKALARLYLERGYQVCGMSRRPPGELAGHPNMHFAACDMRNLHEAQEVASRLLDQVGHAPPEIVFLNAGKFGDAPRLAHETTPSQFEDVLALNLLANKAILDVCFTRAKKPECIVISSSISAIRPRAGMLSYAVSKAALNTLAQVYRQENPEVFFAVLGLCSVDTDLAAAVRKAGPSFPELCALRERVLQPGYLVSAQDRAVHVAAVVDQRDRLGVVSGQFHEIRELIPLLA